MLPFIAKEGTQLRDYHPSSSWVDHNVSFTVQNLESLVKEKNEGKLWFLLLKQSLLKFSSEETTSTGYFFKCASQSGHYLYESCFAKFRCLNDLYQSPLYFITNSLVCTLCWKYTFPCTLLGELQIYLLSCH